MASFSPRSFFSSLFSPASFGARWECEGDALVIDMVPGTMSEHALEPVLTNWWSASDDKRDEICERYLGLAQRACDLVVLWRTGAHRLGASRSPFKGVPQDVHALIVPLEDSARNSYVSLLMAADQRQKEELSQLVLGRCLMVLLYASRIEISSDFYRFGIASPLPSSVASQMKKLDECLVRVGARLESTMSTLSRASNDLPLVQVMSAYQAFKIVRERLESLSPNIRFCAHTLILQGLQSIQEWFSVVEEGQIVSPILPNHGMDWARSFSTACDKLQVDYSQLADNPEVLHACSSSIAQDLITRASLSWDDIRKDAAAALAALNADIAEYRAHNDPSLPRYWVYDAERNEEARLHSERISTAEPWRLDVRENSGIVRTLSCTLRLHSRVKDLPPFMPSAQTLHGTYIGSTLS